MYYQLPADDALDTIYTEDLKRALDNNDVDQIKTIQSKPKVFYSILENAITDITNIPNAVTALSQCLVDENNEKAQQVWNCVYNREKMRNGEKSLQDYQKILIQHITNKDEYLQSLINDFCEDQNFDVISYYNSIRQLSEIEDINPFIYLTEKEVDAESFIGFVEQAKETYKQFKIYEPKERIIEALSYKDRVVLMALCSNIIEPKFEKRLIYDNVACRKEKGTDFGIKRLEKFLHSYYKEFGTNKGYVLKCDVRKYFQNIDHTILFNKLKKEKFAEDEIWILKLIIDSKNQEKGVGLPIGNQTSQWFGLYYLDEIDRLIKEKLRIKYYVRYMDDMILLHNDKEYLKYCKEKIEKCANDNLKLELNNKTQILNIKDGIDFLGFRHILTENGKVIKLLRGQAKLKLKRNMKILSKLKESNSVDEDYINVRLTAFYAHICHSNARSLYRRIKKINTL